MESELCVVSVGKSRAGYGNDWSEVESIRAEKGFSGMEQLEDSQSAVKK